MDPISLGMQLIRGVGAADTKSLDFGGRRFRGTRNLFAAWERRKRTDYDRLRNLDGVVIGRFKTSHWEALQNQPVGFMFGNVTVV